MVTLADIITELLESDRLSSSCHGCSNVGDDAVRHLSLTFPEFAAEVERLGYRDRDPESSYDVKFVKGTEDE